MIVMQIMQAPSPKLAVSYDPETKRLVYETAEIIGLVQLENPEEDEVQCVPCYLVANDYGTFWVPELEYNFLRYVEVGRRLVADFEPTASQIAAIEAVYKEIVDSLAETKTETIEVETRGKISTIKRTIKPRKPEGSDDT